VGKCQVERATQVPGGNKGPQESWVVIGDSLITREHSRALEIGHGTHVRSVQVSSGTSDSCNPSYLQEAEIRRIMV
jgi:hypothetical protein